MVVRCPHDDRSSRQLITYSPERRRSAGNAASDVLGCRVRDGVAMTASWPSPIAESASRTIDTDALVRRAGNRELAIMIQRLVAKRVQKRMSKGNSTHGYR